MGRPLTYDQPLIAVSVNGRGAAWCADQWAGDQEVIDAAKVAIRLRQPVEIGYKRFTASVDSLTGIAAALFAYSPGRTLLVKAPDEVADEIRAGYPQGDFTPSPSEG